MRIIFFASSLGLAAFRRINNIANNLVVKFKGGPRDSNKQGTNTSKEHLAKPLADNQAQVTGIAHGLTHAKENLKVASHHLDAVLIDDNSYNHKYWQYEAKKSKKTLKCFTTLADFDREAEQIPVGTSIYIDLNLRDGVKGPDVAANLRDRGFEKLYIATASVSFNHKDYPWLAGVRDKTPPFSF